MEALSEVPADDNQGKGDHQIHGSSPSAIKYVHLRALWSKYLLLSNWVFLCIFCRNFPINIDHRGLSVFLLKTAISSTPTWTTASEFKPYLPTDWNDKTFKEYLTHKGLTPNLIHYVLFAIAGGEHSMPCLEGVRECKKFLMSLGRYGNTPFLWPMYGSGELPQCFCR